jgi:hypothetical protein
MCIMEICLPELCNVGQEGKLYEGFEETLHNKGRHISMIHLLPIFICFVTNLFITFIINYYYF